jgi:hypothetical protein
MDLKLRKVVKLYEESYPHLDDYQILTLAHQKMILDAINESKESLTNIEGSISDIEYKVRSIENKMEED